MANFVVYTCITGNYDWLWPPLVSPKNIHYVCFSDSYLGFKNGWEIRSIPDGLRNLPNNLINRYIKLFPHKFFPEYEWSVYVDGNVRILGDLTQALDILEKNNFLIGCPRHPDRSNIYQERIACKSLGKFLGSDAEIVDTQITAYELEGMPIDQPLTENNFIVRKHVDPAIHKIMNDWWGQIEKYSKRDQISFPYVVWKSELSVFMFDFSSSSNNGYIKRVGHRGSKTNVIKIKNFIRAKEADGGGWRYVSFLLRLFSRLRRMFMS